MWDGRRVAQRLWKGMWVVASRDVTPIAHLAKPLGWRLEPRTSAVCECV